LQRQRKFDRDRAPIESKSGNMERPFSRAARTHSVSFTQHAYAHKGERMFNTLKSMIRSEEGASMVEYGLLISLIAVVAMIGVKALGTNVSTLYTTVAGTI